VTGTSASWLKPSLRLNGLDPDNMPDAPSRQYDSSASFAGKKWLDVWAAGQGLGTIHQTAPMASIVDQLVLEYTTATQRLQALPYPQRSFQ
jgi:nitronate monooxygenase